MAYLKATLDRSRSTIVFTGPGTFNAKERIKALGPASFNPAEKSWTLRVTVPPEVLLEQFPGLVLEENEHVERGEREGPDDIAVPGLPPGKTVVQVVQELRGAIAKAFPGSFYLKGVLTKVSRRGQACFLELAEPTQRDVYIDCVMWSESDRICKPLADLGFELEAELPVMFEVRLSINQKGGRISCVVLAVVAEYTTGKLAAQRELTNRRLQEEGLFDRNRSLALPFLPRRLGILTSSGGTVINDFRAALDEATFGFELFWLSVSVQGRNAPREIVSGLNRLAGLPQLDAIVLFRGGGSPSELAVFNDYQVARAICLCPLPVISSIGHQADQSSAQDVSYRALGVPKDVGAFFAAIVVDLRRRFLENTSRIGDRSAALVERREAVLTSLAHLVVSRATTATSRRFDSISRLIQMIPGLAVGRLKTALRRLDDISSPIPALTRSVVRDVDRGLRHSTRSFLRNANYRASERTQRLAGAATKLVERASLSCARAEHRLAATETALRTGAPRIITERTARLEGLSQLIEGARPEVQLRRGFVLVRREGESGYLTSGESLKTGDNVTLQFHDTLRGAKVE